MSATPRPTTEPPDDDPGCLFWLLMFAPTAAVIYVLISGLLLGQAPQRELVGIVMVLTVGTILAMRRMVRAKRRAARAHLVCRTCGYDLRSGSGVLSTCPECGTPGPAKIVVEDSI